MDERMIERMDRTRKERMDEENLEMRIRLTPEVSTKNTREGWNGEDEHKQELE